MGIFKSLSKIAEAGLEAGAGAVKSLTDVPREFAQLGSNIGSAASDALDKARGVERTGSSATSRALKKGVTGADFTRPTNTAQKVGFAAGQIAQLATPVGSAKGAQVGGRIAKAVGGSEKVVNFASKLGGLSLNSLVQGGIATVQSGSPKEGAIVAGTNMAATPILFGAGKIASGIAKTASSALSGVPKQAFEKAFRDPNAVRKAISFAADAGDDAIPQIYQRTLGALDELDALKSATYQSNLAEVASSKVDDLSVEGAQEAFTDTLGKFRIGYKKGLVDTSSSKLPKGYQNAVQDIADEINDWTDTSPVGMDTLITRLKNLRKVGETTGDRQFNSILGSVTDDISEYVVKKVPEVGKLRSDYAKQSELTDLIRTELLNGKDSTSVKKLANIFSPNNSIYRKVINELGEKTGNDFLADIAGVILSKGTPDGLGKYMSTVVTSSLSAQGIAALTPGIGQAAAVAAIPVVGVGASPRAAGEVAMAAGRLAPAAAPAARGLAGFIGKTIDALTGRNKSGGDTQQETQTSQPIQSPEAVYPQYQSQIQRAREQGISDEEIMLYLQSKLSR